MHDMLCMQLEGPRRTLSHVKGDNVGLMLEKVNFMQGLAFWKVVMAPGYLVACAEGLCCYVVSVKLVTWEVKSYHNKSSSLV